jgi:hypothetical protein
MSEVLLGFVGDLLLNREQPDDVFRATGDALKTPDILFGNLEGAYSDDPKPPPGLNAMISGRARNLDAFSRAGFDVLSLANNHILDIGVDAMLENRTRLQAQGIATCGAGANLDEARTPAVVEANGVRVAYLAYASIFPLGFEATPARPGLVPVRAYDLWRTPLPHIHMPGARPVATTVPDEVDKTALALDIRQARKQADLVVASFHWGDQTRAFHLTDHEIRTARFAIEQGADMVIGHHHHAIRGMEWYRGKPILYGLGHFTFDFVLGMTAAELAVHLADMHAGDFWDAEYAVAPREGWPYLPMHEDTRMTVLAYARATADGIEEIGFLPCMIEADGHVRPLALGTEECEMLLYYFERCNRHHRLNGRAEAGSRSLGGFQCVRVAAAS